MLRVRHPNVVRETVDDPDHRVTIDGDTYELDTDHTVALPERAAERWADAYGLSVADIRVDEDVTDSDTADDGTLGENSDAQGESVTEDDTLGVPELRENVGAGTVEDTEWVREALAEVDDVELRRDARSLSGKGSELGAYINDLLMDDGVCPWCDEYGGDAVPQHASAAHPDAWAAYTEGE